MRKCPYCDFNSHRAGDSPPRASYVDALINDLRLEAESGRAADRKISTVFIGGGTPSLFDGGEIATIINAIDASLELEDGAEITMEANPGTVERGNLAHYRQAGINRLSLGAQSFSARSLTRLGRIHGPQEIESAFAAARNAGFDNINLDIMFALPGQTLSAAADDVKKAIALGPQHISYYQLTLEPNTVFHSRPPDDLPDDDLSWSMQQAGHELLTQAGFAQYEVSAFAAAGRLCEHNMNYWQFGDYLAVGAGAHGKVTDPDGAVWRYQKPAHPTTYITQGHSGNFDSRLRQLARDDVAFEFMLNVLRLNEGFSENSYTSRTGLPFSSVAVAIDQARIDGFLACNDIGIWAPTGRGMRFLNDLQGRFLP